jgi:hypothetical protein
LKVNGFGIIPPYARVDRRLDKELRYPIQLENMRYFGMLMKKK